MDGSHLADFLLEKGYDVYTYIHKTTNHPKCPDWAVGSDLLNGLPRGNKK